MRSEPFRVLVADPPWPFGDKLGARGAEANYNVLSIDEIRNFPLPPLNVFSTLFLWRVSAMVEEAYQVCRAWGFTPKSELVWLKRTKHDKRWFGMGRTVRAEHETCIIAQRGEPFCKNNSTRSTFSAKAGRHSEKPEEFFQIVESMFNGPYCELFARRTRPGWTCLGNELQLVEPKLEKCKSNARFGISLTSGKRENERC